MVREPGATWAVFLSINESQTTFGFGFQLHGTTFHELNTHVVMTFTLDATQLGHLRGHRKFVWAAVGRGSEKSSGCPGPCSGRGRG